jgi:hypothetical protein
MSNKQNILKTATIRNSKLCRESENYAQYFVFDKERDNKGWDFVTEGTLFGVSGGYYFMSTLGRDVALSRSNNFGAVDASIYTEVVVRYKYIKNRVDSVATTGKIQFITASDPTFTEEKSTTFEVIPDGQWHIYRINMGPVSSWIGFILNLKIFFGLNGQTGDEVLVSHIKIQQPKFIFCTESCYLDSSVTEVGENFDTEVIGNSPQNFSIVDSSTTKTALISRDPATFSNQVLNLSNTIGSSSGPKAIRILSNSVTSGFLSARFLVTGVGAVLKLKTNVLSDLDLISLKIDTDGRLKYKSGPSFIDLTDLTPISTNVWHDLLITFNGDTFLFDISVDGQTVGTGLSYLLAGQLVAVELANSAVAINNVYFDDLLVVAQDELSIICPGIGRQGQAEGQEVLFSKLDILENINDTLIINLNGFGDVIIKLDPRNGMDPLEVRDALEQKICALDLGGYPYAEVSFLDGKFIIKSGTYGFDSTVVIKKHQTSSLVEDLGFISGNDIIYVSQTGRPHSNSFKFTNNYRAKTKDLLSLKDNKDFQFNLLHDPTDFTVEAGSRFAAETGRKNVIAGTNKTVIDFYHRASEEGLLTKAYFHGTLPKNISTKLTGDFGQVSNNLFNTGIADLSQYKIVDGDLLIINSPGYASNGTYVIEVSSNNGGYLRVTGNKTLTPGVNLTFTIQTYVKLKHFRPKLDGTLDLINETQLGQRVAGQVYTNSPDSFLADVNWYAHRGDLFGIYNAVSIFVGNDANGNPDALYLEEDGDLLGTSIIVGEPKGQGIKGIGLYLQSEEYQTKGAYDILFDSPVTIKTVDIIGKQKAEKRYYNLATASNNGFNLSVTITGTHNHRVDTGSGPATITHNNVPYNITALSDGMKYASNGFLGQFQQNNAQAVYFYISGDGEFAYYEFDEDGNIIENSLEFPISSNGSGGYNGTLNQFISDYKDDPFDIRFSWNVPKTIERFKIYFKEFPNAKTYFLQWLKEPGSSFDGDEPGYERIGEGNSAEFTKVLLNGLLIDKTKSISNAFYQHLLPTFDTNPTAGGESSPNDLYYTLYYPYTVLDKYFDPIETTSLIWKCLFHESTKISEVEVYSASESPTSLETAVEFYFSSDGEFFQRIDPEVQTDGTLRFNIGFPVKAARIIVEPESSAFLDKIKFSPIDEFIKYLDYETNAVIPVIDVDIVRGGFSNPERISVTNLTGQSADLELSIQTDELTDSLLLKTSLNSLEETVTPEIGPPGFIYLSEGNDLAVTQNVAINAQAYGLKNLVTGKKYHLGISAQSPSDYMASGIDLTKWTVSGLNFPKASPNGLEYLTTSGGIGMRLFNQAYGGPDDGATHSTRATPNWNVTGSFSASIAGQYNMIRGSANSAGTRIGIIDSTGRRIFIEKARVRYEASGGFNRQRNWSEYNITDSTIGNLHTNLNFCATPARCGTTFGTLDDNAEYLLTLTRIVDTNYDVLRISYTDTVNGTGVSQFGNSPYIEFNLRTLPTQLVGAIKVYIEVFWVDNNNDAISETATAPFNYVKINRFLFGGSSTYDTSYDFEANYKLVGTSGTILEDNIVTNLGDSIKMLAIDLERRYSLDTLKLWSVSGLPSWNSFNTLFSNSETTNPDSVIWGNSDTSDVRWILFIEQALPEGTVSGIKFLDRVRAYPDITRLAPGQTINSDWDSLGTTLTDGNYNSNSQVSNIDYPVVLVKFPNHFTLTDFEALDSSGREFPTNNDYNTFKGWPLHSSFNVSSSNTEDPKLVSWSPWVEYTSDFKNLTDTKWLAFKSDEFNFNSPRHIAEVTAKTAGLRSDDIGQVKDRVDFTEYAEWFQVEYYYDKNIAILEEDETILEGILYGASAQRQTTSGFISATSAAFDESDTEGIYLINTPAYVWRAFGEVTATSGGEDTIISGTDGNQYVISGNQPAAVVTLIEQEISGFSFNVFGDTKSIPNTIAIQRLVGTDPTLDASWSTITTETNLATQVSIEDDLGAEEYVFNNGNPFTYKFNPHIVTSGLRLAITATVDETSLDRTSNISEFRIFTPIDQTVEEVVTLTNDTQVREGGRRSLKLTYQANSTTSVKINAASAFRVDPDPLWSIQDYLSFWIKADLGFDFSSSYLRFGTDSDHFYEWNLNSISGSVNSETLSLVSLKFKDATVVNKIGFNYERDTAEDRLTPLDFTVQDFTFLQLEIKPVGTPVSNLSMWLDDFYLTRESFGIPGIPGTNALYLNNSELVYYPISDFDIRKGYFEAIIIPDWDSSGILDVRVEQVFTIFSSLNSLNESFSCYYSQRYGLVFIAYSQITQERHRFYCGKLPNIQKYKPFKLGVAWDSTAEGIASGANVTLRVWLNDTKLKEFIEPWDIQKTKDSYFFLGSRAYQNDVAISGTSDYPKFIDDAILVPTTSSLVGGIQNVLLSKVPERVYFEEIQYLKDKIYLSIDGINYYNGADPTLPITIYSIAPGSSVDVWIKVNLPNSLKNLSRVGYLRTRWRLTS